MDVMGKCKHKWDESNQYRQPCLKCDAIRFLMSKKSVAIGEPQIDWEIKEFPDFSKLPKPPAPPKARKLKNLDG